MSRSGVAAVAAFLILVTVLGVFAVSGRSDPFTPLPTPCPIEALEQAVEDAQAAWDAVTPQPNSRKNFNASEWKELTEAGKRLQAAREGERIECL